MESVLPCVRDLGTGLTRLSVLWLSRCCLRDLDGLPSLSSLKVCPTCVHVCHMVCSMRGGVVTDTGVVHFIQ